MAAVSWQCRLFWALKLLLVISVCSAVDTEYNVGLGRADITGPAAQVNMVWFILKKKHGCFMQRFNLHL